jgi:hypothetical protein
VFFCSSRREEKRRGEERREERRRGEKRREEKEIGELGFFYLQQNRIE